MKKFWVLFKDNAFFRNSSILFLGTMTVNVLNYIFHLVVGRMVSPSVYGEVESLISLLVIISVPAGTLTLIATKYAAEMRANQDRLGTEKLSQFFNYKLRQYGIPLVLLMLILSPFIKNFLNVGSYFPIFFLWGVVILSFLSAVTLGLLTGWQQFASINKISIISTSLKLICVVILVWAGWNVNGVWGGLVLAAIFGYLVSLYFLRKLIGSFHVVADQAEYKLQIDSLKSYILPVFYGTLSMAILGNADMVFAKHHLEASLSGGYGALSVVAKTIFFFTGVLTTVLFAMSAEDDRQGEQTKKTFQSALWSVSIMVLGATLFFSLFPQFVFGLLFGDKYLSASPLLGWFALAAGIYSIANLLMQYLLSRREVRVTTFLLIVSSLEIVTLFFFGENVYAIIGITIGAQVLATVVGVVFLMKQKAICPKSFP